MKILDLYAERVAPGGMSTIPVRTRCIDDYLTTCIEQGIRQVVILGAGYDTRAYRFAALKGGVKVFEVDHPATQNVKREKIKKILGYLPDYVVYVPIDFEKEKVDERLFESGYDRSLKTLFIWEGVTMYVTGEAVDETLAFVVHNSGEGSSIIFDYVLGSALDGRLREAEGWKRYLEKRGDPPIFGIEDGTIEEFLGSRGFHQVKDITAKALDDTYFADKDCSRKATPFTPIVHAAVKPRQA
jgi:methyltransferase (TIGR00027 family)